MVTFRILEPWTLNASKASSTACFDRRNTEQQAAPALWECKGMVLVVLNVTIQYHQDLTGFEMKRILGVYGTP